MLDSLLERLFNPFEDGAKILNFARKIFDILGRRLDSADGLVKLEVDIGADRRPAIPEIIESGSAIEHGSRIARR